MFSVNVSKIIPFKLGATLLTADKISFGAYELEKGLTPIGWASIVIISSGLLFGAIYLLSKIFKNKKLK